MTRGLGMGGHQSAKMLNDEWLTPPEIVKALGPFDLDPCAPVTRPWDTARCHYTVNDNGLICEWFGRVWCNPPYGKHTRQWLDRCAEHKKAIALVFARVETETFFSQVWEKATALLFIEGRLHFHHVDGTRAKANSGCPLVLIAYDDEGAYQLRSSGIRGSFVQNWRTQ